MGDESRFRYRRDENSASDGRTPRAERPAAPAPRGEPGGSRADDALAELARLIGDEDPFADFGDLRKPEPEPTRTRPRAEPAPMPKFSAPPVERRFDDWQPGRRGLREPPPGTPAPQAPAPQPAPPVDEWADQTRGSVRSGYGSLSRRPEPEPQADYDYDEPAPAPAPRAAAGYAPAAAPAHPQSLGRGQYAEDDAAYAFGAQRDQYEDYDDAYDPAYTDDGYMPPHDDDLYDPEPARRKNRMILAMVAGGIVLAVIGVGGVFAYRMNSSNESTQSAGTQPPVIKAGSAPVKTAGPTPSTPSSDGQKLIYDRVGGAQTSNERVVPREEQPVDVNAAAAANQAVNGGTTEPKKVKTLTVRADGTVVTPQTAPAQTPSRPVGVAPVAYAPNQNPLPVAPPTPTPVTPVPTTSSAPSAPAATAAVTPAPTAPAGSGAYVVQVSSQKSETDALGSWKVLQSRYPQLLGSYKATVKKADLGDRGVYYRAQVGPFTTREQANDLCNSLRAQGGDCLVQKN